MGAPSETLGVAIDYMKDGLEQLKDGYQLTSQQEGLITTALNASRATARTAAERSLTEGLQAVFDEIGPARGLRPGDTPNLDRAGRIVAEYQRQMGEAESTFQREGALARLNYPIEAGQAGSQARSQYAQQLLGLARAQTEQEQAESARRLALIQGIGVTGQNLLGQGTQLATAATGRPYFGEYTTSIPQFEPSIALGEGISAAGLGLREGMQDVDFGAFEERLRGLFEREPDPFEPLDSRRFFDRDPVDFSQDVAPRFIG